MSRRKRRKFTAEEKAEAVQLVKSTDRSVYRIAQELDLTETALRRWVQQADADADAEEGVSGPLSTAEREELRKLRRDNRRLRMERDFLKEAAAFFARDGSSWSK